MIRKNDVASVPKTAQLSTVGLIHSTAAQTHFCNPEQPPLMMMIHVTNALTHNIYNIQV